MGKKNGLVNSEMITEVHVSLQFGFLNEVSILIVKDTILNLW